MGYRPSINLHKVLVRIVAIRVQAEYSEYLRPSLRAKGGRGRFRYPKMHWSRHTSLAKNFLPDEKKMLIWKR